MILKGAKDSLQADGEVTRQNDCPELVRALHDLRKSIGEPVEQPGECRGALDYKVVEIGKRHNALDLLDVELANRAGEGRRERGVPIGVVVARYRCFNLAVRVYDANLDDLDPKWQLLYYEPPALFTPHSGVDCEYNGCHIGDKGNIVLEQCHYFFVASIPDSGTDCDINKRTCGQSGIDWERVLPKIIDAHLSWEPIRDAKNGVGAIFSGHGV